MLQHTLSRKACVAIAAMVDLELHADTGPVSLGPLAQRLQVSLSYLEQIFSLLRRPGLLQSSRGRGGGYVLARAACQISLADIVGALCKTSRASRHNRDEPAAWAHLDSRMTDFLASVSVEDLIEERDRPLVHGNASDAEPALRRGISRRPVLQPVALPRHVNSVFFLSEALK